MVPLQNAIFAMTIPPQDANGATPTATVFDTAQITNNLGPSTTVFCLIMLGNIAADATSCIVQESSVSNFGSDTATVVTFTNPTASGSDNTMLGATINMGARKRYFRVVFTGGAAATLVTAIFVALPTGISPTTAALRGLAQFQTV